VTSPTPRSLGALIGLLEARGLLRSVLSAGVTSPAGMEVRGVTMDSRSVVPGSLFVAVPGRHVDGHEFAPAAVAAGAVAVMGERAVAGVAVPQLLVRGVRPALALAAAWVHDFPSTKLGIVGVTGTDGKTTTAYLIRAMLEACSYPTGMIGTIDVVAGGRSLGNTARTTTPESPELQAHLASMLAAGDRFVVVESTSHGLAHDRVAEIAYDVAVLTNVTSEHLEFHGSLEAYRAAKRRLFEWVGPSSGNPDKGWGKHAVLNLDDPISADFGRAAREVGARVITYGADPTADVRPSTVREDAAGLRVGVATPRWRADVTLRMAGRFNVHNALAAVAAGEALGLDPEGMREGLASVEGVPGRMQRIEAGQPFRVVVDFAHTAESLAKVLDNLAPLAAAGGGGLIAVFGSAGDRDTQKRPAMGRVAAERSRLIVITDEDPRSEDRLAILDEIAAGAESLGRRRGQDLLLIADRREAITRALGAAGPGDVVLLTGKGHEKTIEMIDGAIPWDEARVAREVLAELGYHDSKA
jgi:UDP-N-acetylmuramoyl-L-alanyl-D-glutamate--2,6-diaminopimelate ligase